MRGLRLPVLAALALGVIALVAVIGTAPQTDKDDPSSRNAGRGGTLALYTWLHDGLRIDGVHRLSGSFDLGGLDMLVVHEPSVAITDTETSRIVDFLRGGGELLLTVDRTDIGDAAAVLDRIGVAPQQSLTATTAHPVQPFDTGDRLHDVPLADGAVAFAGSRDTTPILAAGGDEVMVGAPVGRGRAFVLGSPYPLSNAGLRPDRSPRSDAYALVLGLLARLRGGQIAIDEVHHGEGGSATGAVAVLAGPVGAAAGLAAVVVFVSLLLGGRRLGSPLAAGDAARVPSAGDFVEAMARLHERSHVRGAIADAYAAELKQRVARATGADAHLDDDAFGNALAGYGTDRADEVRDALRQARRLSAGRPSDAELVELARSIDAIERRW